MHGSRWGVGAGIVAALAVGGTVWFMGQRDTSPLPYRSPMNGATVERIATDVGPVTRIIFTPDGSTMLVGRLTGEVEAWTRSAEESWTRPSEPLVTIQTGFPGFPAEENGLTGLALEGDYDHGGDLFVTYAVRIDDKDFRNRIARIELAEADGTLEASEPTDIFEANAPAASSHQIDDAVGVTVEGQPHVLFLIGEGFKAERARDLSQEGGKLMLIQRDGTDPLGPRPYPEHPKLQAIGIRNAPSLAINEFDPSRRIGIVDTGPDRFDRFIYGQFLPEGSSEPIDLAWDGTEASLQRDVADGNTSDAPNMVLYRWNPTHTATNLVFHPGQGPIPRSTDRTTSVLVSLFGQTGGTGKKIPGRAIWLGKLSLTGQPRVSWKPFIVRSKIGINTQGHPLALARDPTTNDLVFADILESALYQVQLEE